MANFDEHIDQAKSNLDFLQSVNSFANGNWSWQVTVAFYVGVHLVNAHIAKIENQHYRSHEKVNDALNPFNNLSTSFGENEYTAYMILQNLSRRARYLCHHDGDKVGGNEKAQFTYDVHFTRAIHQLDIIMAFMSDNHGVKFKKIQLDCIGIKGKTHKYFTYNSNASQEVHVE